MREQRRAQRHVAATVAALLSRSMRPILGPTRGGQLDQPRPALATGGQQSPSPGGVRGRQVVGRRRPAGTRPACPARSRRRPRSRDPGPPRRRRRRRGRQPKPAVAAGHRAPPAGRCAAAPSASSPTAARSSEPHGKWTVTNEAKPASSAGSCSAPAAMKRAFGRPPLRAGRAARREASRIATWLASMASTSSFGCWAARCRTYRPSPAPRSIETAECAAARSVS